MPTTPRLGEGVDRLVKEGHALAASDAEELERRLEQQPNDLDARARLLGYYARCCRQERMAAPRKLATESLPPPVRSQAPTRAVGD